MGRMDVHEYVSIGLQLCRVRMRSKRKGSLALSLLIDRRAPPSSLFGQLRWNWWAVPALVGRVCTPANQSSATISAAPPIWHYLTHRNTYIMAKSSSHAFPRGFSFSTLIVRHRRTSLPPSLISSSQFKIPFRIQQLPTISRPLFSRSLKVESSMIRASSTLSTERKSTNSEHIDTPR